MSTGQSSNDPRDSDYVKTRREDVPPMRPSLRPVQRTPTPREVNFEDEAAPSRPPARARNDETMPFRPAQRPAMALLCIVDDGQDEGEIVRLRADKYVLGRVEGDIRIPHDSLISARHAELSRQLDKGETSWCICDLGSTNGTYFRIATATMEANQQVLIGGKQYRFDDPLQAVCAAADAADDAPGTRRAFGNKVGSLLPALVELTEQGEGQRYPIPQAECWIGRDPQQCAVVLASDAMVNPRHVRIFRDNAGRWNLEDAKSHNGTWLRVNKVRFKRTSQFMLGEQRFILRFLR